MIYQIGLWLMLTCLCAILYRMGGASGYNTKFRDLGCPIVVGLCVNIIGGYHWSIIASCLLMFGAMTQYWKGDRTDCRWYDWFITGLMYAVAWLPYVYFTGNQFGFALYAILVSISTAVWSEICDDVVFEECGRGAIVAFFSPLLAGIIK